VCFSQKLCQGVLGCGCGPCEDELESFWACAVGANNGTCEMNCLTEKSDSPTGPLCPNEFDTYRSCVFDELAEPQKTNCDSCRLAASASIPLDIQDCSVVSEIFCNAVQTCDCGPCGAPLEEYLNCDVYKRWFGECQVDCGVASTSRAQQEATSSAFTRGTYRGAFAIAVATVIFF
jgi:hypothetical protein